MMMKKYVGILIINVLILFGCSSQDQPNLDSHEQTDSNQQDMEIYEVIADNLNIPWSIEKQDDIFYLTERVGYIVQVENGEIERQEVELEKDISTASEAGLLGFLLSPDFAESNLAYAYYTYEDSTGQFNRVITLRLEENIWWEESLLLDQIPSGRVHHGGRLKIGPDGLLYVTTGDAAVPDIAQDLDSLGGKILRMNLDGSIPSDNPYANSYVYSYGHRNPQGITWSSDGTLYASEHGNRANDEINLIAAGHNYGWPIIEGEEEQDGMESPLFTSGRSNTWAPSGIAYDNNTLYVAALRGAAVIEFNLETGEHRLVITEYGRIRDVLIVDGYLYFISNNTDGRGTPHANDDKLFRVSLSELR